MWPFDISKRRRQRIESAYSKICVHTQRKGRLNYRTDINDEKTKNLITKIESQRNGKRPKLFQRLSEEIGDEVVKILYQHNRRSRYFVTNSNLKRRNPNQTYK